MHSIFLYLKKSNTFIQKILEFIVGITLITMVLLIFAQVIFRYVLQLPLSWAEELTQYVFSWLIFAGAAIAYRENKHISVELLATSITNKTIKKILSCIVHLFLLFFLFIIVFYSLPISLQLIQLNKVAVSMPALKMGYVYLIIPISSIISIFMVLENLMKIFLPEEGK